MSGSHCDRQRQPRGCQPPMAGPRGARRWRTINKKKSCGTLAGAGRAHTSDRYRSDRCSSARSHAKLCCRERPLHKTDACSSGKFEISRPSRPSLILAMAVARRVCCVCVGGGRPFNFHVVSRSFVHAPKGTRARGVDGLQIIHGRGRPLRQRQGRVDERRRGEEPRRCGTPDGCCRGPARGAGRQSSPQCHQSQRTVWLQRIDSSALERREKLHGDRPNSYRWRGARGRTGLQSVDASDGRRAKGKCRLGSLAAGTWCGPDIAGQGSDGTRHGRFLRG